MYPIFLRKASIDLGLGSLVFQKLVPSSNLRPIYGTLNLVIRYLYTLCHVLRHLPRQGYTNPTDAGEHR